MRTHRTAGSPVVRTALPAEAPAVAALHARARSTYYPDGLPDDGTDWPAGWAEAIGRTDRRVLCAVLDGRLVGIASFHLPRGAPAESVELLQFHTDPGHWGRGVGTALHRACVEEWQADGRRTAVLSVHAGNARAQAFYAGRGWVPDLRQPPAEGDHHLLMRLTVAGE
ncbi:GNAT family N-acetyltransferase [Streptomyces sp. NPDC000987]|uniref:GNAT family N-acetyltransferase n=1 Tax=Streptomyces sp. NPDC000987 TaxID=3154374 RepID=UPI00332B7C0E